MTWQWWRVEVLHADMSVHFDAIKAPNESIAHRKATMNWPKAKAVFVSGLWTELDEELWESVFGKKASAE